MSHNQGVKRAVALTLAMSVFSGCAGDMALRTDAPAAYPTPASPPSAPSPLGSGGSEVDAQISTALIQLAQDKDRIRRDLTNAQGTPVGDILAVGSPIGYALRNRFLNLGVPLADAFARNPDPVFRVQLLELARWDRNGETRASALIALAGRQDIAHLQVFNEALIHLDPAVRFGALEALIQWGHPREAMPLLAAASERDTEVLLRVYASAGLARLGDPAGLHRLRQFLESPSWLTKALAAKYLGELGTSEDYDNILNRIDREVSNDFVVAEFCVAALKLYPKKKK